MDERLRPLYEGGFRGLTCTVSEVMGLARVLVVGFAGVYPNGSEGNPHAAWMTEQTATAAQAKGVRLIILDLRDFEYWLGDALLQVWMVVEGMPGSKQPEHVPVWVVTGPECDERIRSLLDLAGWSTAHVYGDLESALAAA